MYVAAFVGLGRIASLLEDDPLREKPATHAGALAAHPECSIAGGTDTDEERRRLFSERWDAPSFPDAASMIERLRPDILVVATHPDTHRRYVELAAGFSVPVVICEKPLAHTLADARRIVAVEKSGKTRIVVNHERRFSRDYRLAAAAVREKTFGELVSTTARLFFGRTARRDRVFLHDGTHLVDAIHFLTGETIAIRRRYGTMRTNRSSTFLVGTLSRSGSPVMIEHGSERDYLLFEIVLSFTGGEIRVGNGEFEWRRSVESLYYSGYRSLAASSRVRPEPSGYFSGVAEEAISLRRDPGRTSDSKAADAHAAMKVIASAGGTFGRRLWNG